jgi:hypothetical protein
LLTVTPIATSAAKSAPVASTGSGVALDATTTIAATGTP